MPNTVHSGVSADSVVRTKDGKTFEEGVSSLNYLLTESPTGRLDMTNTNALYGINAGEANLHLKPEVEVAGYTFVVRPQLNLASYNIRKAPDMMDLLTDDKKSIWMYIRNLLDPRLVHNNPEIKSALLDHEQAFIIPISNSIKGVSGWPSRVTPTKETTPGIRKEQMIFPNGDRNIMNNFDLDLVCTNFAGSVLEKIMDMWQKWMLCNHEGLFLPTPDWMAGTERTYDTRVYRLVMSSDYKYVRRIACTGSSIPIIAEDGKYFDYDGASYRLGNKDVNVRMASSGARYNDMIIMHWFNETVKIFKPAMRHIDKDHQSETDDLLKVPQEHLMLFNYRCYPRINLYTFELEWWVDKKYIKKIEKGEK